MISLNTSRKEWKSYCCNCRSSTSERQQDTASAPNAFQQCSRCKLTRYCSRGCQAKHFPAHKKNCKVISKLLRGEQEQAIDNNNPLQKKIRLAHMTFMTAYESCDVPTRGAFMFEIAYKNYLEVLELLIDTTSEKQESEHTDIGNEHEVVDMLVLLLVTLQRYDEACSLIWWTTSNQDYSTNDEIIQVSYVSSYSTDVVPLDKLHPTILVLLLVLKLRLVAQHNNDRGNAFHEDSSAGQGTTTNNNNVVVEQEHPSESDFDKDSQLRFIREDVLTTIQSSAPAVYTMLCKDGFKSMALGLELFPRDEIQMFHFYLLQDLVYMMPGVEDVLEQCLGST